eukprot:c90_g1_i1.p1 GENE.c90_g1_i1~~c90_g1_i1.p1  ORF type:complete len:221 (+),score=44.16 c90_g1_i1:28-690(+)
MTDQHRTRLEVCGEVKTLQLEVEVEGGDDIVPEVGDDATIDDLMDVWERQGDREQSGCKIWNTSIITSRLLLSRPLFHFLSSKRIIEIGAGAGVLSITLSHVSPSVVSTDHTPQVLALLQHNLANNQSFAVAVESLDWNDSVSDAHRNAFDVAIVCDVLYDPSAMKPLVNCLQSLMNPATGRALVVTPPFREGVGMFAAELLEVRLLFHRFSSLSLRNRS